MKDHFSKRQNFFNMAGQGIAFAINLLIGFFLTPFIVKHIGSTANGFFVLSNNILSLASLAVIALNSMAGRFIAIAYFQKRELDVQKYYSSVFIANIVICLLLSLPAIVFLIFLPSVLQVPTELFRDVTILFAFTFIQFAIIQIGGVFNNSVYVVNRLDLIAFRNIESKILYAGLIFLTFCIWKPHLWQLGLIHIFTAIYMVARNYFIHHSVMPQVRIESRYFEWHKVQELVVSGVWNLISSLGNILFENLDLLIINVFISAAAMGAISVARTIPMFVSGILFSIASTVAPSITKYYAETRYREIVQIILFNMKLMVLLGSAAVAFLVTFGEAFFRLWVPSMDAHELWLLASTVCLSLPLTIPFVPLYAPYMAANKVRVSALVNIVTTLLSLTVLWFLLKNTDNMFLKIISVLTINKIFRIFSGVFFTIPYISRVVLHYPMKSFYWCYVKTSLIGIVCPLLCYLLGRYIQLNSWFALIVGGVCTSFVCFVLCSFALFDHEEKLRAFNWIKNHLPLLSK